MKYNKNRLIISSILMILVLLISWPLLRKSNYNLSKENLINKEDINKIIIKSKENKIVIQKEEKWFILEPIRYLGDSEKVDKLLNILEKTKIENLVSDNIEYFDKFDVNDEKGIFVSIYNNDNLLKEIIIGKMDNNFFKSYVRIGKEIYLIDSNISHTFHINVDDLKNKKIFNINKDQITSIKFIFEKGNRIGTITKKENNFYLDGKEYKNIETFIDEILKLRIHNFKKKDEVINSLNEFVTLEVKDINNQTYLLFNSEKDESYKLSMLRLMDSEIYFNISNYSLKQIEEFKFE